MARERHLSRRGLLRRLAGASTAAVGAGLGSSLLDPEGAAATGRSERGVDPVIGSWFAHVTQGNVAGFPPEFDVVLSFIDGGIFAGSGPIASGLGSWVRTPEGRYALTTIGYGANPLLGVKLRAVMRLGEQGRVLSGPMAYKVFDPGGRTVLTNTGGMSGHRMPVEPV